MKVGITTFHWSDNYGAVLQAYALQTFLERRGHSVEIIDYRKGAKPSRVTAALARFPAWLPHMVLRLLSPLAGILPGRLRGAIEARYKKFLFERFRIKHLKLTPRLHCIESLRSVGSNYDVLITGSDQVWNPRFLDEGNGHFDAYFLKYAGPKTHTMAYAASIGHADTSTMTAEWRQQLASRMGAVHAIGVRETSSLPLVEQLCGRRDAVQVVDPTLLLPVSDYARLTGKPGPSGTLFAYLLHGLEADADPLCREVAKLKQLTIVRCNARLSMLHPGYDLPGPDGWLQHIRNASFVITNSFHGTVFCLIFHVPFISVLINNHLGSMNARIIDLLDAVGLSQRTMTNGGHLPDEIAISPINWEQVDRQLQSIRQTSTNFLQSQAL
jgi:hypothetical protein